MSWRWKLVCRDCAKGESIRTIGSLARAPQNCAACEKPLPAWENGLADGNPVDDIQLDRIRCRMRGEPEPPTVTATHGARGGYVVREFFTTSNPNPRQIVVTHRDLERDADGNIITKRLRYIGVRIAKRD